MNEQPREMYIQITQAVLRLGEDWMLDYDGVYAGTEDWVSHRSDKGLAQVIAEIDFLFALTPDTATRLKMFSTEYAFSSRDDSFDVWLRALQQRAKEALAGIRSNPLVDPEPPQE